MKKLLSIVALIALSISVLTSCSKKEETATKDVELKMVITSEDQEGNAMQKATEKYTKETGVKFKLIVLPSNEYSSKIITMQSANDSPDLARGGDWRSFKPETVATIDSVVPKGTIIDSVDARGKNAKGETKSVLINVTSVGLIANKTILDKYDIKIPPVDKPWTWEEYIAILEKLKGKDGVKYPMVMDRSSLRFEAMQKAFGANTYSDDGKKITQYSKASVKAAETFKMLFDKELMPKGTWIGNDDPQAMFKTGEVAFHWAGSWVGADYLKSAKFDWVAVPSPKDSVVATSIGGNDLTVFETKNKEEAMKFVKWFLKSENYSEFVTNGGHIPTVNKVEAKYSDPKLQTFLDLFIKQLDGIDPKILSNGVNVPERVGKDLGGVIRDNLALMLNGNLTPDEAMKKSAEKFAELTTLPLEPK